MGLASRTALASAVGTLVTVRNTFLHFVTDDDEELEVVGRCPGRAKTQPAFKGAAAVDWCFEEDDRDSSAEEALAVLRNVPSPGRATGRRNLPNSPSPSSADSSPQGTGLDACSGIKCASVNEETPSSVRTLSPTGGTSTQSSGGHTPPSCAELARGVVCSGSPGGSLTLEWAVEERRISCQDKMLVSPTFDLLLPGLGSLPFKLVLHAVVGQKKGKGAQGFKSADGWARVELKCCADLPAGAVAIISISIGVGSGARGQPLRGPAVHNLSKLSCCGLPKGADTWHLLPAVDPVVRRAVIRVEVRPIECRSK